jgi:glycogen debranching enzyme
VTQNRVPHPIEVLYGGGSTLACGLDGQLRADELHGLFAGDTRVLSTYRLAIGGETWQPLGRSRSGSGSGQWRFQSPAVREPHTGEIPQSAMFLRIDRRLSGALHDDIVLSYYAPEPVRTTLVLQLDADFADIFEVRKQSVPARLAVQRIPRADGVTLVYDRGGFRRGVHVTLRASQGVPQLAGSLVVFDLVLAYGDEWRCCLQAEPQVDGEVIRFAGDPHAPEETPPRPSAPSLRAPALVREPFERGRADLADLPISEDGEPPYLAAGVPWFYTLFGRDSLMPALMAGLVGSGPARGALTALGARQAADRDDWRDAEPGKLPHELRRGELAHLDRIPHTPYYGAHDVPSLYCLTLWNAWRWTGDRRLLDDHLETARAGLRWCFEHGDRDGDGLQEYATRSRRGYYNQSWKDAADALLHADGRLPELPLATVELQGYLYAACLAMAELEEASGEAAEADRLRAEARRLRTLVEERFWLVDEAFYAIALDGRKEPVASISSNPGQLLWCGLPGQERASAVARRLLAPELFTGWGLRTLSNEHPRYNPLSYQIGSVWPHDTALAAAGLTRYGLREEAGALLRAVLEAACAFEDDRLPELFGGFERSIGAPVPYREANVPQAWASAAPILAVQLFLGLVPDAPHGRCFLAPWLPEWLPSVRVRGIELGGGTVGVCLARGDETTVIDELAGTDIDVIAGEASAPLWGRPPDEALSA